MSAQAAFREDAPLPATALEALAWVDAKDAEIARLRDALLYIAKGPWCDGDEQHIRETAYAALGLDPLADDDEAVSR